MRIRGDGEGRPGAAGVRESSGGWGASAGAGLGVHPRTVELLEGCVGGCVCGRVVACRAVPRAPEKQVAPQLCLPPRYRAPRATHTHTPPYRWTVHPRANPGGSAPGAVSAATGTRVAASRIRPGVLFSLCPLTCAEAHPV